jgi:uncharacterized radical SAM superfamily Fe-S cluster-containing enzyme
VFLDVTNRCNLNCPICINNTPSMGFTFEPPLDYFEQVFSRLQHYSPRPPVQLFGGEPTVRKDLFEIISMARSYGLSVRVVTNGLRLADADYCRRLVESRTTILIAYDGARPRTYRALRGSEKALELKEQAIENLRDLPKAKVALMTCVAKGFNDDELPELLSLCHKLRGNIRGVYFMPLVQSWDRDDFSLEPERVTVEDIELLLEQCCGGERIDFVPAGVFGAMPRLIEYLRLKRPPFMGAHPNCESMYLLVSDGEHYVPLSRFIKGALPDVMRSLMKAEERFARAEQGLRDSRRGRLLAALGLRESWLTLRAWLGAGRAVLGHLRVSRMLQGRGPGKLWHAASLTAGLLLGKERRELLRRHLTCANTLQLIVLPFEDDATLETQRLERCPNAFVYYDPVEDRLDTVPACAWGRHKNEVLKKISAHYAADQAVHA